VPLPWNFGNFEDFSVSGTKYDDQTGDGLSEDDVAWDSSTLGAVTVFVDMDGSGTLNDGDISTVTDEFGNWSIDELSLTAVGKNILEITPDGSVETTGVVNTVDNPGSGGEDGTNDFANFRLFDISGFKWYDQNRDGAWDDDEAGYNGFTIYLGVDVDGDDIADYVLDSAVTANNETYDGYYAFTNLSFLGDPDEDGFADRYVVYEAPVDNWVQSFPASVNGYVVDATSGNDSAGVYGSGEGEEGSDLNFGNYQLEGPGVRTPGFWSNWEEYWDGDRSNDPKQVGQGDDDAECGFAEHDVLTLDPDTPTNGLLIGDYNLNGLTDGGEDTLFLSLDDALKYINASNKTVNGDAQFMVYRDVVATWLNYLAGNEIGTGEGSAQDWLDEAIDWLENTSSPVKSNSAAWKTGVANDFEGEGGTTAAGSAIHGALDEYNNTGWIDGVQYAADPDCSDAWVL